MGTIFEKDRVNLVWLSEICQELYVYTDPALFTPPVWPQNSDPCIIGLTLFAAFPIVSHSAAASAANRRASVPTIASIAGLSFSQVERTCSSTERACNQRPRSCLCTTRTALMRTRTPTCPASNLTVRCLARRGCPSPAPSSPCFCFSQNATKPYYEK